MLAKRKILGLAVTGRSITAVEVVAANGGGRMRRAAEFAFPEGAGLEQPVALGKALRQFLRREGFSASRCVIGMEANRLTARHKTIPPAADEAVPQLLALMIEREFASDRDGLVFDYAAGPDPTAERSVLLVAAPRRVVEQLTAMAEAARLTVAGVTPATPALAAAAGESTAQDQLVLHLFRGGAELVVCCRGEMRLIRRLSATVPDEMSPRDGWLGELTEELYRVVALLPAEQGRPGARPRELVVWDENCLDQQSCAELSESLSLPATLCRRPEGLDGMAAESVPAGAQVSAAAALALDALRGRPPAVDLLHSRLAPRKRLAIGRKVAWASAVVAAIVIAGAAVLLDWHMDSLETADLRTRVEGMAEDRARAEAVINKVTFARSWHDRRPSYLEGMRELTAAFPQEGVIWATSLAVKEDLQVVFSGKAVSESAVLDVLDRLRANPRLAAVKQLYIRQAGRRGREVAFAMSFTCLQTETKWSLTSERELSSRQR